ncbi:hypothetical protein [Pseudomonas sp. B329]|uniref:hypothetical protein n=1 Tax=Pseudomonas sp. B329 TaxID=1553459 RepID=UPI002003242A|nr:hypothetical protein [Pseudomonas sp. B329]MCK3864739.1 hypothetical protein [Pseudomonas sp. B329]
MNTTPYKAMKSKLPMTLYTAAIFVSCPIVSAMDQPTGNVSGEYRNCRFQDTGDGQLNFYVTVPFNQVKPGENSSSRHSFYSRAIAVYTYGKDGTPSNTYDATVYINDISAAFHYPSFNTQIYISGHYTWTNHDAFDAEIRVRLPKYSVSDWPGIAIRTANYASTPQVNQETYFDAKGAVYIPQTDGPAGSCRIINPETPPPQDITLNVSVPSWNFGELQPGIAEKTLGNTKDQLCFTYNSAETIGQKFVINASNTHGLIDNNYRLRHLTNLSSFPYSLILNDGKNKPLKIPNNTRNTITLDSSGRTCFSPTIRTNISKSQLEGSYFDILNFNVTTKP